jgi:UV DNA damage repair endonuclease
VTVENDETSFGLDAVLELADLVPTVLDIHHHWIASGGEYIEPDDPRVARIVESWRGTRPLCHISVSREGLLPGHPTDVRPDYVALTASGVKGRDLMGHSDLMWNEAVNALVARHLAWADFEIEAKLKNLATVPLSAQLRGATPALVAG